MDAVGWLRSLFPDLPLPPEATDEDLRAVVGNGRLLCALLRRLLPGALLDDAATDNVGRFRAAIQRMGVPTFSAYDLERVSRLLVPRPCHGATALRGCLVALSCSHRTLDTCTKY